MPTSLHCSETPEILKCQKFNHVVHLHQVSQSSYSGTVSVTFSSFGPLTTAPVGLQSFISLSSIRLQAPELSGRCQRASERTCGSSFLGFSYCYTLTVKDLEVLSGPGLSA